MSFREGLSLSFSPLTLFNSATQISAVVFLMLARELFESLKALDSCLRSSMKGQALLREFSNYFSQFLNSYVV